MKIDENQLDVLRDAVNTYGATDQYNMLVGEFGELLTLFGRRAQNRDTREDWISEIADCMIMLEQLAYMFGRDDVKTRIDQKIDRLKLRLEDYKA